MSRSSSIGNRSSSGRSPLPRAVTVIAVACLLGVTGTSDAATTLPPPDGLRRFAVIAGNDEGGDGTRPLLYAREDAQKIHGILTRLGGVRPEDAELVLNQTAETFLGALGRIEARVQAASRQGERTALFIYYSGHAKDGALRLGTSTLSFAALKHRLAQAPADVKVGIFDACQSGALTRRKGARRAPDFEIQTDAQSGSRGVVILTSSAADEDSQESDLISGSYFSHHLASGLLGDADRSADGRVSLGEAYLYAYERTVADTAGSAAGAQHPTYSYDFQGNGDLVLTSFVDRNEGLLFAAHAPKGTWYVVDARGFVVAEVIKPEGAERRLAVAPGTYRIKRRLPDRLRIGEVSVAGGRFTRVDEARLKDAPFSDDPVKGLSRARGEHLAIAIGGLFQSFFDAGSRQSLFPSVAMLGAEANLHGYLRRGWILGFDVHAGTGRQTLRLEGLPELAYGYSQLSAGTTIGVEWPLGRFAPWVGGRIALQIMSRNFENEQLPDQLFMTLSPGLVGGVRYQLTDRVSLGARGRVHYLLYNVDENRSLGYWELAAQVGYQWEMP